MIRFIFCEAGHTKSVEVRSKQCLEMEDYDEKENSIIVWYWSLDICIDSWVRERTV